MDVCQFFSFPFLSVFSPLPDEQDIVEDRKDKSNNSPRNMANITNLIGSACFLISQNMRIFWRVRTIIPFLHSFTPYSQPKEQDQGKDGERQRKDEENFNK
jgi:transcriptional regulator of met regulon